MVLTKKPPFGRLLAVRTGLEPATPCVTGMYSNQAELPDQQKNERENFNAAKIHFQIKYAMPFRKIITPW